MMPNEPPKIQSIHNLPDPLEFPGKLTFRVEQSNEEFRRRFEEQLQKFIKGKHDPTKVST